MIEIDFFGSSGPRSSRDRREKIAKFVPDPVKRANFVQYGYNYYDDGDYGVGYGGYRYDGRYAESVEKMIGYYRLPAGAAVLEIGCAKGFVLVEFHKRGMKVAGIDISAYAIENAVPEIKPYLVEGSCETLPWEADRFDFVYCKEALPHLTRDQLPSAVAEAQRVCNSDNIFFEIQVADDADGRKLMKTWDETHQCIESTAWWREYLGGLGYRGQANFKKLF